MNIKTYFLLLLMPLLANTALAQVDSMKIKTDRLYINKHLPLYLWVSSSPDGKSNAIKLEGTQNNRYANPFYLDTEGMNTIFPNYGTKLQKNERRIYLPNLKYKVYSDGLPPISRYRLSNSKRSYEKGQFYYKKGLTISLSAIDGMSGTDNIYYKINDSEYKTYEQEIRLNESGEFQIFFYAEDIVGNKEKPRKIILNIQAD
jgi:hypothetical protein